MRGKADIVAKRVDSSGITPAYAGKSAHEALEIVPKKDHPRVCGEKAGREAPRERANGSPPRMRGKVFLEGFCKAAFGITPAYAGKSEKLRFVLYN